MARITVEDCVKIVPNRFELCLVASNRAKSVLSGAPTEFDNKEKASVIALREIAEGKIEIDQIKENIVKLIKNKGKAENSNVSNSDVNQIFADESESAIGIKETNLVSENLEVED